jgi:hypothetical protein
MNLETEDLGKINLNNYIVGIYVYMQNIYMQYYSKYFIYVLFYL